MWSLLKVTKAPEWHQWVRSGVFSVNFKHITYHFYCWLCTGKCLMVGKSKPLLVANCFPGFKSSSWIYLYPQFYFWNNFDISHLLKKNKKTKKKGMTYSIQTPTSKVDPSFLGKTKSFTPGKVIWHCQEANIFWESATKTGTPEIRGQKAICLLIVVLVIR